MGRNKKPRSDKILEEIRAALVELKLRGMLEALEEETKAGPQSSESRYNLLWRLLECQLRQRRERAVERRIKKARFPGHKTLDAFDFEFQTGVEKTQIMDLATLEFVRRGQNLLLAGMSGTGKSHIAISLGFLACAARHRVRYTTNSAMLSTLYASLATDTLDRALAPYLRCDLLIIDEVGLDGTERAHDLDAQLFYRVISPRYQAPTSTIITSNIEWKTWGSHFGDDVATVAILDRLAHRGFSITIDGPSYRAREHKRLNGNKGVGD